MTSGGTASGVRERFTMKRDYSIPAASAACEILSHSLSDAMAPRWRRPCSAFMMLPELEMRATYQP